MYEVVVVGTDGSLTADKAVARAAELVSQVGGSLHIVTAYRPSTPQKAGGERASVSEEYDSGPSPDDEARAVLRSAGALALQGGIAAETHAREGDPAKVLLSVSAELDAELIVVGSKGVARRIFGSVPNSVTQNASCDVLVVYTA